MLNIEHGIKFYYQNSNLLRINMLSSGFKRPYNKPVSTSALSSIQSDDINGSKARPVSSKRGSEISILEKLNSSKFKNIQDFEIPNKISLPHDSRSKYFVLNQEIETESHKLKSHNQPYKYNQADEKMLTFSPINIKHIQSQSSANPKRSNQEKQNLLTRTPPRQRFLNPTQSWMQKITPQKQPQKSSLHNHSKTVYEKQSYVPFSIHEQLYMQSRKKQMKRSAQQIIENQYFKKVHPFKPEVSQVSQFLAQQKRIKIKQRQRFEKEFQSFSQWQSAESQSKEKSKKTRQGQQNHIEAGKLKQNNQKQTELKNYEILKQFFFYLSQNEPTLAYSNLNPKRLCELPSACINLLEPILEQFYKNKKTKRLEWLQFLSQFNLKVKKRKSFYPLIEKWFWLNYKIRFDSKCKASFVQDQKCNKNDNEQNSTYVGHETTDNEDKRAKLKRVY